MASRLQDVIQRGLSSAKPLATAVAIGTLYYSTDTQITERSDGTTWQSYNDAGTGATLPIDLTTDVTGILPAANIGPHASTHNAGGSDPITITTAQLPAHHTTHEAGGTDPIQLDNLAGPDDNVDLNASTTAHGLLPKLSGVATTFLNGTGSWSTPPSGGGGTGDVTGPASSFDGNLPVFSGATGKILKQNPVRIDDTGVIFLVDDIRITFNPGSNAAGLNVGAVFSDPGTLTPGDLWYDLGNNLLKARIGSQTIQLGIANVIRLTEITFASRPTGVPTGTLVNISDSTVNTPGSTIAGGGTNHVLAKYNGTNWVVVG